MSKKISLNPKYTNNSGNSWSKTTYNNLEYHISTNKTSSSVSTLKCEFTTPYDNIDVVVEIGSSSENNYDWCYIVKLDDSDAAYDNYLDRISGLLTDYSPKFKTVTINVAKAGTHFLIIGYRKDGSGNVGHDCGYFRLVTTEVDSMEPDPYIYCGTKTVVSEEPIKFTKTNISNGQNGQRNWYDYEGTSKDYLWQASVGDDNSLKTAKISFTTSNDNATIILKYYIRLYGGSFRVSYLDGNVSNSMIYKSGSVGETITKKINVPKAGEHFILISYDEGSFGAEIYVGFFGTNVVTNTRTLVPERILANNKNIGKVYVGSNLIWGRKKYLPKFSIYLQGTGIGNTQYTFKYDNSHVFNSTKIDDDNIVINYDADALTIDANHIFSKSITPTSWNNSNVTFKLVNAAPINDRTHPGVEIFKELNVKKLDLTKFDLTGSPNFNSFNNIFINLGTVNVVTGPNFDTRYINTFEGAFAIPRGKPVLDFSNSPNFKINSSANRTNIFYANSINGNHFKFILNKNIDDFTKSVFNSTGQIEVTYV